MAAAGQGAGVMVGLERLATLLTGDVYAGRAAIDDLVEGLRAALQEGADPAPIRAMIAGLPAPPTPVAAVALLLLRATLLGEPTTTTALAQVADDMEGPAPHFTLRQADYILRATIFGVWTNRLTVVDPGAHDLVQRRLWRALLTHYRPTLAGKVPAAPAQRQRDLVVVMTGQFVRGMHQPSLDIMDFVGKLVLRLGRRVVLVNTADGPAEAAFPLLGGFLSTADAGLAEARQLVIDRLPVPFLHLPAGFTDPATAAATIDHLLELRPDLVLSFGTLSPVADLCRGLLEVVAIPFGSYLPFTQATYLALPRPLRPGDAAGLAISGLTPEKVIGIDYTYALPASGAARDRAELGVPGDAILVAVVGLRLTQEVTSDFAAALADALTREPRLFFLFIGPMENFDAVIGSRPVLAARSRAHGYETDVLAVLKAADLYLNPPRGGGGTSAAYALACGVPAYGLGWGDVATVIGPDFQLADYGAFAAASTRFADDAGWRQALQAKARARFAQISSRETMLRQILDGVRKIRAGG